jgi:hypothetical protein
MRLFTTRDPDATPWWAKRRTLGAALAITALVASGAAANASANGDGFLSIGGTSTTSGNPTSPTSTAGRGTIGSTAAAGTTGWTWNGDGANRFAFRTLVSRADPKFTQLLGINDRGTIVGFFGSGADPKHPNRGFRLQPPYRQTSFIPENFPRAVQTQAVGINNDATSAGFFVDRLGANHGYVRVHGHFRAVDFPGTTSRPAFNQLLGINRMGIAVGFFNDRANRSHAYAFNVRTGQFTLIKLPVKTASVVASGINDRGQVVGFFQLGRGIRGFIWGPHLFAVLDLGNHTNTQALGINNFGVVVGSFVDLQGKTRGFVRANARLVRVVNVPGSTSTVVNGINNNGQIVGFFTDGAKNTFGFLAHR